MLRDRWSVMLGSRAGYLDLGGQGRSVTLLVRMPTVPDLKVLCRWVKRKKWEIPPGGIQKRARDTAGVSGEHLAEVSEAFFRDRLGRPLDQDELVDVLESVGGASLIILRVSGAVRLWYDAGPNP